MSKRAPHSGPNRGAPNLGSPRARLRPSLPAWPRVMARALLRRSSDSPPTSAHIDTNYSPEDDGAPDPGEVVWTWVPYEDDPSQGKDRPVLVIAVAPDHIIALGMTSKDHDRDADQEAAAGRYWHDIGTGPWDRRRRPSEVRLNRILRLDISKIRREGGHVSAAVYQQVLAAAAPYLKE